jgi:hypothetical protein
VFGHQTPSFEDCLAILLVLGSGWNLCRIPSFASSLEK